MDRYPTRGSQLADYRSGDLPSLIAYVLLFVLFVYAVVMEVQDVRCPTTNATNEECDLGGGMSFSGSRPEPSDSCDVLLNKIDNAAGYEVKSVKWRRSFIISTVLVLVLLLVGGISGGAFPAWHNLYLYVVLGFVVILGFNMYYGYHIFRKAEGWIFDSTDLLREKFCPDSRSTRVNSAQ